jgi:hypothetical protein
MELLSGECTAITSCPGKSAADQPPVAFSPSRWVGEWERVRYRNIMKRHGRVLTEADEKRLLLKVRRWRSQCARTWAKDGPKSEALAQRFRTLALAKFGPVRCEEWGLLKQKDPMAIWTDPPQGQDIWHILRTE